jgi:hypothetical protein
MASPIDDAFLPSRALVRQVHNSYYAGGTDGAQRAAVCLWQSGGKSRNAARKTPIRQITQTGFFAKKNKGVAEGMGFEPTIRLLTV